MDLDIHEVRGEIDRFINRDVEDIDELITSAIYIDADIDHLMLDVENLDK